jgi:hypothetical protein
MCLASDPVIQLHLRGQEVNCNEGFLHFATLKSVEKWAHYETNKKGFEF